MRISYTYSNTLLNENLLFSENKTITKKQNTILLYEKANHLGNVLSTVSDRKLPVESTSTAGIIDYYTAEIQSSTDYYAFGAPMPGRRFYGSIDYRYGYQGSEKDNEIKGNGNMFTTSFRELDTRLGRWWTIDPEAKNKAHESPYVSMGNTPIWHNDILGNTDKPNKQESNKKEEKGGKEKPKPIPASNVGSNKKDGSPQNGKDDIVENALLTTSVAVKSQSMKCGPIKEVKYMYGVPMYSLEKIPVVTPETKIGYMTDPIDNNFHGFKIVKVPSTAINVAAKTIGVAATAVGVVSYGNDIVDFADGNLSGNRFTLRSVGSIGGALVGASSAGGAAGAAVGVGATAAEMLYDLGKWYGGLVSEWNAQTEKALSGGWMPSNPMQIFSDSTLKRSISLAENDSLSNKLKQLDIYSYNYVTDSKYGYTSKDIGLIAQDVEKILPNCIYTVNGKKIIDYTRLIPIMIADLNKKDNDIEELKAMMKKLEILVIKQANEHKNASEK